jgi:hypothetical protein
MLEHGVDRVVAIDPGRNAPVSGRDQHGVTFSISRGEFNSISGQAAWRQQLLAWKQAARLVPGHAGSPTVLAAEGALGLATPRSPRASAVLAALRLELRLVGGLRAFYGSPAVRLARLTVRA